MIVCVCNKVSDKAIRACVSAGLTFDDMQIDLGIATQCGQCECHARDVIRQCHADKASCPQSCQGSLKACTPLSPLPAWQPLGMPATTGQ